MKPFGSIFTGFGGADIGAREAGFELAWGIESEEAIAQTCNTNLGNHCLIQSALDTNWMRLDRVDWLHASPPCPSFSAAKARRRETALDEAIAQSVCDALSVLQPQWFTLENVEGYGRSKSFAQITNTLFSLGYWAQWSVLNSADFGVPQTRRRLILRAVKGGFLPSLPQPVQWVGWYEAIADLIPTLPESKFAEWQLERLPTAFKSTCLVKAFLVDGIANSNGATVTVIESDRPSFTIKASAAKQASRAWIDEGRVVAMTARALARFQGFPDWYELPASNPLACKGIGNAVPPELIKTIGQSWEVPNA